ncbi:hypothetical protein SAMN04488024_10817 [Pedobacter soli]|uniref:Uncharacterized protein n=1 Tax=Pedobacter soli TaxID=390242 RepID=A0A1G6XUA1_9SPHI|nr:hypothetical protein SAMN04488024_10817 [Pedobacter soli]
MVDFFLYLASHQDRFVVSRVNFNNSKKNNILVVQYAALYVMVENSFSPHGVQSRVLF